jgi:hypothetical protein
MQGMAFGYAVTAIRKLNAIKSRSTLDPQTTFAYSYQIDIIACHRIILSPEAAIQSTALTGLKKSGCRLIKKIQRRGARKIDERGVYG